MAIARAKMVTILTTIIGLEAKIKGCIINGVDGRNFH